VILNLNHSTTLLITLLFIFKLKTNINSKYLGVKHDTYILYFILIKFWASISHTLPLLTTNFTGSSLALIINPTIYGVKLIKHVSIINIQQCYGSEIHWRDRFPLVDIAPGTNGNQRFFIPRYVI